MSMTLYDGIIKKEYENYIDENIHSSQEKDDQVFAVKKEESDTLVGDWTIEDSERKPFSNKMEQEVILETEYSDPFDSFRTCYYCGLITVSLGKLRKHIVIKHLLKKITRLDISRSNDFKVSFKGRRKSVSSSVRKEKKPYRCKYCPFKNSEIRKIKRHIMAKHTGEKPFSCTLCSYRCTTAYDVKRHTMVKHLNDRPFGCSICSYKSSQLIHLKAHMMAMHSEEKPYGCTLCSYKSVQFSSLKSHMAKHSGSKPFACFNCQYRSAHKKDLRRHIMAKHTGEKPVKCNKCTYRCVDSSALTKHFQRKHKLCVCNSVK